MSLLVQIAAEFTGKKALKEADKSINNLTKSTKKLAGALGVALSTTALVNFGKASVKAFVEAEKANSRLANSVDNLGLSFATANIQSYLDGISRSAGIAGEVLVDAFQPLLTTTGSVAKSQEILNQALDVAAATGTDLATVTQDLANAYVGNTKGLKKYYIGLTQAELKNASFLDIQKQLNEQSSGAQSKYLSTYAGKMQVLGEAAGNAQELIGGALLQSVQDIFGAKDVTELIGKIDKLTGKVVGMIDTLTWKWKQFWFVTSDRALLENLNPFSTYVKNGLDKLDAEKAASVWRRAMAGAAGFDPSENAVTGYAKSAAAIKKAEADARKRAQDIINAQKKNTAELKKQAALKKAGTVFDLTQIQMIAALKGQLTEEEKMRVQALLAIENENVTVATRLTNEILKAQDATGALARLLRDLPTANNPFANWNIPGVNYIPSTNATNVSTVTQAMGYAGAGSTAMAEKQSYVINVAGSVVSEQGLIDAVRGGLNVASLSGSGSTVRRIGGF